MRKILSREEIRSLDQTACEQALEDWLQDPIIDQDIRNNPELWALTDQIADAICYLQDHRARLIMETNLARAAEVSLAVRRKNAADRDIEEDID